MVRVSTNGPTVMCMKVTSLTVNVTVMVLWYIIMAIHTQVNGAMIVSMVRVL